MFFETLQSHWGFISSTPRKDYFSPSVICASLNTKIFVKANSERKKYEFVFDKVVFLINKGNGKNEKVRTKLHVSRKNFKLYTEKTL